MQQRRMILFVGKSNHLRFNDKHIEFSLIDMLPAVLYNFEYKGQVPG